MLLAEKLLILSIESKTKRPYGRTAPLLSYTLNAALLAELMLKEKIALIDSKLSAIEETDEDSLLDETLKIIQSKPNQTAKQMIGILRREHQNIVLKLAKKLDGKGLLTVESKELLGKPIAHFYKIENDHLLLEYKNKFNQLVTRKKNNESLNGEKDKLILLALVYHSHLLKIILPDKEAYKAAQDLVKADYSDLPLAKETKELIDSIDISIISAAGQFTL